MKFVKWLAISFLVLLLLLTIFIFAAPSLFGDRLRASVKTEIERYVDADVEFGEVEFSIFRSFPKLAVEIDSIAVDGRGAFDSIRLAQIDELAISVDFWSAISGGEIQVHGVDLVGPQFHMITLADGKTNIDIMKNVEDVNQAASDTTAAVNISLERYSIIDGEIIYDDRAGDIFLKLSNLDHEGSGDFTATTFDLDTETSIEAIDFKTAGVTYLRKAKLNYIAKLLVDMDASTVTLADNELKLNELGLNANGFVGIPGEDGSIPMKLTFVAPSQDFRSIWSVVPAAFTKDLAGLKTSGSFSLNAALDGVYKPELQSLPAFALDLVVDNGSVQYPDLPKALTNINLKAGVRSGGRDLSDLLLDVERFAFELGNNPFSGRLKVKNGLTDPAFDLVAKGTLDLADLSQALPLEGVNEIAGLVKLDVTAAGTASGAENDLRSIDSRGLAEVQNVVYDAVDMPRVEVASGVARFNGRDLDLEGIMVKAGRSDVAVSGKLVDPFAVATETGTLGGNLAMKGRLLDANEWLEPTATTTTSLPIGSDEAVAATRPFDRFDIGYDAAFQEIKYDVYDLTDVAVRGDVSSERLAITAGTASLMGSKMEMSGQLDNLYGFSFDDGELTGALKFKAGTLDLLQLAEIGVDPNAPAATTSAADAEYIALPENMSIRIAAVIDKLVYDGMELSNVSGLIAMANQGAVIENGNAKMLGGNIKIDGGYQYLGESTPPTFDLKYDIQNASFKQAFEQVNTIQQLAPIAQYLSGSFNTNLVMSSSLGRDMLPNLRELDADGFVATLNASLDDFAPLRKIADKLNIKELRSLDLKNTKNWFTITDGTVDVRPFDVSWNGINATVGGKHGLDAAMDYEIIALVPRKLLGDNAVGGAVNTGLDFLGGQASKLGINLAAGEFIRVKIGLTGSMTDPDVTFKLLGTEGEGGMKGAAGAALKDLAQQARDSIENLGRAKLDAAKASAEAKARSVADSVRSAAETRARAAADEAKAKAQAEAQRLAGKAADEAKSRAAEEARKAAEQAADKAGQDAKDKAKDAIQGIFGKKKPDE